MERMSPLKLRMLLHYYSGPGDFMDGLFHAPAVRSAIDDLRDKDFLIEYGDTDICTTYRLTDRGKAFVHALCRLPLPVQCWRMPGGSQKHE